MELSTEKNKNVPEEERQRPKEIIQYIVIRLGEEQYGIDIRNIDTITRMSHITRVPKMPSYLRGVINLRGMVIPVMSIRLRMDLPADQITKATRIIVLKLEQEGNVGLIVDEVKEVVSLDTEDIEKLGDSAKDGRANLINAVGKHNGELISLFDLNAISLEG